MERYIRKKNNTLLAHKLDCSSEHGLYSIIELLSGHCSYTMSYSYGDKYPRFAFETKGTPYFVYHGDYIYFDNDAGVLRGEQENNFENKWEPEDRGE